MVCFRCFKDAVQDGAGLRAVLRIGEKEVLPADDIAFYACFASIKTSMI